MIVLVDNYDSFTYNLYQALAAYDADIRVLRNDAVNSRDVKALCPDAIVFSPGAGHPGTAGNMEDIIRCCYTEIPMLGICLGHQAIAEVFASTITYARLIHHGEADIIQQCAPCPLFDNIPCAFEAARYHSLVVEGLGTELIATARNRSDEIMAIQHRQYPVYGIQFHPESILTPYGARIIENFMKTVKLHM
ncbi:aminodeoxychorismate/anthranilate synthase component II [[Clostridium] innocuum]|nr:aminodeoxychorismate/anthranilate synthase component II [[Clostridium] innocuum]